MEKQVDAIQRQLARALNTFRDQHGDESHWTAAEWQYHDKLVERIKHGDKS